MLNFLGIRVFDYSTKIPDNQVIDRILKYSNTPKILIYNVLGQTAKKLFGGNEASGKFFDSTVASGADPGQDMVLKLTRPCLWFRH